MRCDESQRLARPGAGAAGAIQARETELEFREPFMVERGGVAAGDTIVGSKASKLDSPYAAVVTLLYKPLTQRLGRRGAGASSICIADRTGINTADGFDLEQETPRPVMTTHLRLWPGPGSKRERDSSIRKT